MPWGWNPTEGAVTNYSTSYDEPGWSWQGRGKEDVRLGGSRGTAAEAAVAMAWPTYEAEYLNKRLVGRVGKYNPQLLQDEEKAVYLDKVADDYKEEADEALHTEFLDWLQGRHPDNFNPKPYMNEDGKPVRRYTYQDRTPDDKHVSQPWSTEQAEMWHPTWWGENPLTHIPGVREYLRRNRTHAMEADLEMNMLAEHGPQDLKQAWMYFKHWVKGRPVHANRGQGVETMLDESRGYPVSTRRSDFAHDPPRDDRGDPFHQSDKIISGGNDWNGVGTNTSLAPQTPALMWSAREIDYLMSTNASQNQIRQGQLMGLQEDIYHLEQRDREELADTNFRHQEELANRNLIEMKSASDNVEAAFKVTVDEINRQAQLLQGVVEINQNEIRSSQKAVMESVTAARNEAVRFNDIDGYSIAATQQFDLADQKLQGVSEQLGEIQRQATQFGEAQQLGAESTQSIQDAIVQLQTQVNSMAGQVTDITALIPPQPEPQAEDGSSESRNSFTPGGRAGTSSYQVMGTPPPTPQPTPQRRGSSLFRLPSSSPRILPPNTPATLIPRRDRTGTLITPRQSASGFSWP